MYRAEVHRTRGIFLQFLAELEDMVVHGTRGWIILISPDFVEQFIATYHAICILHEKLKRLEFLGRQDDRLIIAFYFHFPEVDRDIVEAHDLGFRSASC